MQLLTASDISLYYAEKEVFSNVSLEVQPLARIGIVGANGSGKTSLLRVLIGELRPNSGRVDRPKGVRIGYVPQMAPSMTNGTLRDEIMLAVAEVKAMEAEMETVARDLETATGNELEWLQQHYADLLARYQEQGGYDYESAVERAAAGVGLSDRVLETPSASASGGERTRAALARALVSDPDILILDEPTNYLDFQALDWLENTLSRSKHAVVVVSHDRYFLDRVAERIWEVERGRVQTFKGNYSHYRVQKAEQVERQMKEYQKQQEHIAKEEWFIARYHAAERGREARGRLKKLARLERVDAPQQQRAVTFQKSDINVTRTGLVAVSTKGLKVGFRNNGQSFQLLEVPDVQVERGSATAVIGPNGSGKTTMLQTIVGLVPPLAGEVRLGYNVQVGYLRQELGDLPQDKNVLEALQAVKNLTHGEARAFLARFLFQGEDVLKPVSVLSGGERSRLALARLLVLAPNVLVLDEPTTHLDIPSREAMELVLQEYDGTLLFVSHDRLFVSLLADQLLVLEGGRVKFFRDGFDAWVTEERQKQSRREPSAGQAKPRKQSPKSDEALAKREQQKREKQAAELEKAVSTLEGQVKALEKALEEASKKRAINDIIRLSGEYENAKKELERAFERWSAFQEA
jgi:ATP-binding cassette subfamily F protein 3